jgi:hypothetical protein
MDELNDRLSLSPFIFTIPIYALLSALEADSQQLQR